MLIRGKAKKFAATAGACGTAAAMAVLMPLSGVAGATAMLSTPPGPWVESTPVLVTGSGFENGVTTGDTITLVECESNASGTLPTTFDQCDGTTENPNTIILKAAGTFSDEYSPQQLTSIGAPGEQKSNIDCDATHYCVLWAGADPVNNFSGTTAQPIAFSQPFLINGTPPTPESPATIALPIAAAGVAGGTGFLIFRRRRYHSHAA
jgi:hypothetical protein